MAHDRLQTQNANKCRNLSMCHMAHHESMSRSLPGSICMANKAAVDNIGMIHTRGPTLWDLAMG